MKTLKESLLSDMEDILANGEKDIETALRIPSVNDFIKTPYSIRQHSVKWICPTILDKYKKKYPDMVSDLWTGFEFMLDAYNSKITDLQVYLADNTDFVSHKKRLSGWNDNFTGGNLRIYKKMTIDIINALAKKPDLLDKLMLHAYESWKYIKSHEAWLIDVYSLHSLAKENKLMK